MIHSLSVVESLWFFSFVCLPSCFLSSLSPLCLSLFFKGLFLLAPLPSLTASHSSLQNGFLVRLFVLMKWNAAKSLRAFFLFFYLESHRVWVDVAEWELPHLSQVHRNTLLQPCTHLMLALTTIMFFITGEGTVKHVEVEFCGINVVTWSRVE